MKIGVFAYNFAHRKTQEGLLRLFLEGYPVRCVMAANAVKLGIYQSQIRTSPKDLSYVHPQRIADRLGIDYHVVKHNSVACQDLIRGYDLDLGIILGARILKPNIINGFNTGIMNLHPGLLPQNRGLDSMKWAILRNIPQGATAHLINSEIDKGKLIVKQEIPVYEDDTLLDVSLRIHSKELELMIESLRALESRIELQPLGDGEYSSAVPMDVEKDLISAFETYKRNYPSSIHFC